MADPTPYTVSYSFGNFQANSPTTPLPGMALDNELANVASAVATMIVAIESIRRSDGALQNKIVTFDSLEDGLQFLLDPTNGQIVAAAVASAQAAAAAAAASNTSALGHDTAAAASAVAAAASAATVNLSLYLAKANNLAGLGSVVTSRANLGLGSAAVLNSDGAANSVMILDGSARVPDYDGSRLTGIDVLPVGAVLFFPASFAPAGLLGLNGQLLSRGSFPRLWTFANASGNIVAEGSWAANNGAFSTGDLATTFRLPELRGEFIRCWDNGRGIDAGRPIGSFEADSLKDHTHAYNIPVIGSQKPNGAGTTPFDTTAAGGTTGSPSTGAAAETRPRNVALIACIKY